MYNRNRLLGSAGRILSALCGGVAGLIALRLLFRVFIANPANPVTTLVYTVSQPLLFPWIMLWPLSDLPGLALERAALVALGIYLILSLALGLLGQAIVHRAAPLAQHQKEEP